MTKVASIVRHPITATAEGIVDEIRSLTERATTGSVAAEVSYALRVALEDISMTAEQCQARMAEAQKDDPQYLSFRRTIDGFRQSPS